MIRKIIRVPQKISLGFIRLYQKTLSPDHGFFRHAFPFGYCRFQPTCSEYGFQAIKKYGFFKGWLLASWRILRCNPYSEGGSDPLK